MNLNDKLKQERTGLTASQYSDLQELFVDRYVDGMSTKDLVEYVYNDMMQYVENQPEQEFLDDCKDYWDCLLYTSPSPRDATLSRMPSSA